MTTTSSIKPWWALVAALAAGVAAWPARAAAQEVEDQQRAAARDLAKRGAEAFDAGDFASAHDLFRRAHALMPVPSLSVFEARAAEKLGLLVEAMEAYEKTVRYELGDRPPEPFVRAVNDARREMGALRPRVPRLRILVDGRGATDPGVEVRMDGVVVPRALVGVVSPVNPGRRELVATTPWGARGEAVVTVAEGATASAQVVLVGGDPGAARATTSEPRPARGAPAQEPAAADRGAGATQRTLGFVALGVGVVGAGAGVVTGLMAVSKHQEAEDACPNLRCERGSEGEALADDFRTLRTVSTIGYVVGAVGVLGGATLVVTAPSSKNTGARVGPWVSVGAAGVGGRF